MRINDVKPRQIDGDETWNIPYNQLIDAVVEQDGNDNIVRAITKNEEQLPCFFEQSEGHGVFHTELRAQIKNAHKEPNTSRD